VDYKSLDARYQEVSEINANINSKMADKDEMMQAKDGTISFLQAEIHELETEMASYRFSHS
jgi:hypothetical protein